MRVDTQGAVGLDTSIVIGSDGLGLITYFDETGGDLRAAHCVDVLCSQATVATVDAEGLVGHHSSVAIGRDGRPLVSYLDFSGFTGDLKVAHCQDVACTTAELTSLDRAGNVGHYTSIAIGADGLGLIMYLDLDNHDVKVAHCADVACSSATIARLGVAGPAVSGWLEIGKDGLPLISYWTRGTSGLSVLRCTDPQCRPLPVG